MAAGWGVTMPTAIVRAPGLEGPVRGVGGVTILQGEEPKSA